MYSTLYRFYKIIDDAYAHANQTLLRVLLQDQQLIPRLRSLKRYFFLSQSSFLTHLLDLSHSELRKSSKSASLVKLQSLLDLALNTDAVGEDAMFREDVKVIMANSGLYDWLLKVVRVSGDLDGKDLESVKGGHEDSKKDKDDKKQMLGKSITGQMSFISLNGCYSHRRLNPRLSCQVSTIFGHLQKDYIAVSTNLPISSSPQTRGAVSLSDVG
jgi:hypothetical protein